MRLALWTCTFPIDPCPDLSVPSCSCVELCSSKCSLIRPAAVLATFSPSGPWPSKTADSHTTCPSASRNTCVVYASWLTPARPMPGCVAPAIPCENSCGSGTLQCEDRDTRWVLSRTEFLAVSMERLDKSASGAICAPVSSEGRRVAARALGEGVGIPSSTTCSGPTAPLRLLLLSASSTICRFSASPLVLSAARPAFCGEPASGTVRPDVALQDVVTLAPCPPTLLASTCALSTSASFEEAQPITARRRGQRSSRERAFIEQAARAAPKAGSARFRGMPP
mmetsp:Transcript_26972/g.69948  ORF Transcript_26972/g.69948 Transcript_26972/m.69948 type:complete len:281 (+) Transcript_26972:108-950(+)